MMGGKVSHRRRVR